MSKNETAPVEQRDRDAAVDQMTPWEQVGYWKEKARQAEEAREAVNAHLPKYQQALADIKAERLRAEQAEQKLAEAVEVLEPFAVFDDGRAPENLAITSGSGMARRQLTIGDCRRVNTFLATIRSAASGEVGE